MSLDRLAWTTGAVCVSLAVAALVVWPTRWQVAGGVLGGGVLIGVSAWAIRGAVDGVVGPADSGSYGPPRTRRQAIPALVKFFTRHAILALAAYGMMVRLHLDPVGMLVGVSSLVIAAGIAALRRIQRDT